MKPKHTPGPWEFYSMDDVHYIEEKGIPEQTPCIATVHGETNLANAALIAAAPEMLDALIELNKLNGGRDESYHRINALIAKARGET